MASKKIRPKKKTKKATKILKDSLRGKKEVNAKITDKELLKIQKELEQTKGKSILIESDLRKLREQLNACVPTQGVKKKSEVTLRHYKFICKSCVNPFSHKATMPVVEQRFVCPKCSKEHVLEIHPLAIENYRIVLPKTVIHKK